jgi:hypothetical protein
VALAEALGSTNAQAHQRGDTLWVVGGYGHRTTEGRKVTFPTLTALDVPGLITAIVGGGPLAPHVEAGTADALFAVAGGHLVHAAGRFHLVAGHRFDGEYTGAFTQAYTHAIRSFQIHRVGGALAPAEVENVVNAPLLHRRDGNVVPFVFPDGREGFALYGGVFARVPPEVAVRQPVYADGTTLTPEPTFRPRFGHYTAPTLSVLDRRTGAMHTTFFGGMGQFYVGPTGAVIEDRDVPFIDAVTTLSRVADGTPGETVMPVRMPSLLGTNAAFLLATGVARTNGSVVDLASLSGRTLVGYVYGGISAQAPNFDPATTASRRLFAVYLDPTGTSASTPPPAAGGHLAPPVPNPAREESSVTLTLDTPSHVHAEVFDTSGRRMAVLASASYPAGSQRLVLHVDTWSPGMYLVRVRVTPSHGGSRTFVQRALVAR